MNRKRRKRCPFHRIELLWIAEERMCDRLPVSISPRPIVDVTLELRFQTKLPAPVIVGFTYEKLKHLFPRFSQLQTLQVPEEALKLNPGLAYQAEARLDSENFGVLVGPKVFAVGINGPYTAWASVSKGFSEAMAGFLEVDSTIILERFALRYSNFFPGNILSKLNLGIAIADGVITGEDTLLRATMLAEPFKIQTQIATDARIKANDPRLKIDPDLPGTLLILDCYQDHTMFEQDFLHNLQDNLQVAHTKEKQLFFHLLKDEFLQTLNPKYEDAG